jgi:hypothetical protein
VEADAIAGEEFGSGADFHTDASLAACRSVRP